MRSRVFQTALGAAALALLAAGQQAPPSPPAASGQQSAGPATPVPATGSVAPGQQPTPFSVEVTRVSVAFSVTDKKGRFVTGLSKEDFEVLENGKPQIIQEFAAEPGLPLRVAVLIDTSNSIRDRFRFEQEAAVQFVSEILRSNADKAMVVSFDSTPEIVCSMTYDFDRLGNAIRDLRPGGGTSMYDAIKFASDKLGEEQPSYQYRRIMVIVTDGEDNQSRGTMGQALEAAQKADTFIYAISTNNLGAGDTDGDKVLRRLTGDTGGKPYFPFKLEDLADDFNVIAEEVRHQYAILYRPEDLSAAPAFRRVEVRVKGHKELNVRAPAGYFARKG